jgi:hypothetical protein
MKTRPIAAALLLAFAPATFPAPAFAQASAEDPITTMARARFKEGVEFYDKGQYEQARASFLQAYALKKHPAVLLNLAWSCLKGGHALEAEKYFKQFLVDGKDISTDKQRADANDGLNQARAKLGHIEIQAAAGTDVTIDGNHIGTAPVAEPVSVEPGAHTVTFKASDGTTETESVSVLGGEKAVARFRGGAAAGTAAAGATAATTATSAAPAPAGGGSPASPASNESPETTGAASSERETAPPKESAPGGEGPSGGTSPLAPPAHLAPVFILGGVALAGYGLALGMLVVKGQAQDKANQAASAIQSAGGRAGTCVNVQPGSKFYNDCQALITDDNDVNTDATVGNIALGVGIAATLGGIVYWLVADKNKEQTAYRPVLAPMVGPRLGGLSLSGAF